MSEIMVFTVGWATASIIYIERGLEWSYVGYLLCGYA